MHYSRILLTIASTFLLAKTPAFAQCGCSPTLSCPNYSQLHGGYVKSKDVQGFMLSGNLGYIICEEACGYHSLELEIIGLFEHGSKSASWTNIAYINPQSLLTTYSNVNARRKVTMQEFPFMLNYRYTGNLSGKFDWTAGLGVGFSLMHYKTHLSGSQTTISGSITTPIEEEASGMRGSVAGQAFLGFGYVYSECLRFDIASRILAMEKRTIGGGSIPTLPILTGPAVKTDVIHWTLEAGVTFLF